MGIEARARDREMRILSEVRASYEPGNVMKGERPLFSNAELVSEETKKRWRERLDYLLETKDGELSEWEEGFVQDIERLMEKGKPLSLAQSSKLNQIFHKVEEARG